MKKRTLDIVGGRVVVTTKEATPKLSEIGIRRIAAVAEARRQTVAAYLADVVKYETGGQLEGVLVVARRSSVDTAIEIVVPLLCVAGFELGRDYFDGVSSSQPFRRALRLAFEQDKCPEEDCVIAEEIADAALALDVKSARRLAQALARRWAAARRLEDGTAP